MGSPEHKAWKESVVRTGEGGAGGTEASAGVNALSTYMFSSKSGSMGKLQACQGDVTPGEPLHGWHTA